MSLAKEATVSDEAEKKDQASCKSAGRVVPTIDRNRCEGKKDCVEVCPYDVFEIGVLDQAARRALSFGGRVKSFFHGYRQAFVVRGESCHACGLCVTACPEHAIRLTPIS